MTRLRVNLCIVALCIAAVAPILAAPLPPLYDYYHWVFEGELLSRLVFGSSAERAGVLQYYDPVLAPVPNQASAWSLAVLCAFAPPLIAGRIFLAGTVLLFGLGFAFLVRSIQRQPTVAELLAFPWASGYFLYKGYLSYFTSLGLVFLAVGFLLRLKRSVEFPPRGFAWVALSAVSVALYLAHIVGWGIFVVVVLAEGIAVFRKRGAGGALRLTSVLVPSCVLLGWYAVAPGTAHVIDRYHFLADKLRSLAAPLLFFIRLDPLRPVLPVLELNLLFLALMFVAAGIALDRSRRSQPVRPLLAAAAILAAGGICLPIAEVGDLLRPDERLILPAVLLALAALPARPWAGSRALLVVLAVAPICLLHVGEYRSASREFETLIDAINETIPPGVPVVSIGLRPPTSGGGCYPDQQPSLGVLTTKWVGLIRLFEFGGVRANLMPTGIVVRRESTKEVDDVHATGRSLDQIHELGEEARHYSERYDYAVFLGCPEDIRLAEDEFRSYFVELRSGPGYALLGPPALAEDR